MPASDPLETIKTCLREPGSSLLTVPQLAEQTGLTEAAVRQTVADHWRDFRISPKPVDGQHLIGLIEQETDAQRTARLMRGLRGRIIGSRERQDIVDDLARRILEAQEASGAR